MTTERNGLLSTEGNTLYFVFWDTCSLRVRVEHCSNIVCWIRAGLYESSHSSHGRLVVCQLLIKHRRLLRHTEKKVYSLRSPVFAI